LGKIRHGHCQIVNKEILQWISKMALGSELLELCGSIIAAAGACQWSLVWNSGLLEAKEAWPEIFKSSTSPPQQQQLQWLFKNGLGFWASAAASIHFMELWQHHRRRRSLSMKPCMEQWPPWGKRGVAGDFQIIDADAAAAAATAAVTLKNGFGIWASAAASIHFMELCGSITPPPELVNEALKRHGRKFWNHWRHRRRSSSDLKKPPWVLSFSSGFHLFYGTLWKHHRRRRSLSMKPCMELWPPWGKRGTTVTA
jgi:hypothetical protein